MLRQSALVHGGLQMTTGAALALLYPVLLLRVVVALVERRSH